MSAQRVKAKMSTKRITESYYIRSVLGEYNVPKVQVWQIEDECAKDVNVSGGMYLFKAGPGETIWEVLRGAGFERDRFHKTALGPGEFYPRMWRPPVPERTAALGLSPEWNPSAQHETNITNIMAIGRGQLTTLMRQLNRICQTVQPEGPNLDAFGHDIRNLLILACTEAEAHWRGVLVANGVTQKRLNIGNYRKLQKPMKLERYAVNFPNYPWLEAFKPYEKWSVDGSGSSLEWYYAYNAVKHDRETKFEHAKLSHVFDAISACVIMMVSQFGLDEGLGQGSELRSFFHLSGAPDWSLSEFYIYPYGKPPTPVPFGFEAMTS